MNHFKRFYLWAMNVKLFMGIYFAAIMFLSGILLFCFGVRTVRLLTLLEIFAAAIAVAVAQVLLLPDSTDFLKGVFFARSVLWLILSGAMIGAAAHFGAWFAGLPAWCPLVLAFAMIAGCIAMLTGLRFEQERDTIHLNESLERYHQQ